MIGKSIELTQVGGGQGSDPCRVGGTRCPLNGHRVLFCADEKVLKLDGGGGCISL